MTVVITAKSTTIYPTRNNVDEVLQEGIAKLPIVNQNDLVALLHLQRNTVVNLLHTDEVDVLKARVAKMNKANRTMYGNMCTVVKSGADVRARLLKAEGILRGHGLYDCLDAETEEGE